MSKNIYGIHHIALKCHGYEHFKKAVEFYRDVLGLEVAHEWDDGDNSRMLLDTGAGFIEILANGDDISREGSIRHVALAVRDTDAIIEIARNAGYPITVEPKDIVIPSGTPFPARIGYCQGPAGEAVEFFCVK